LPAIPGSGTGLVIGTTPATSGAAEQVWSYTLANAAFAMSVEGEQLRVSVDSDEGWAARMSRLPASGRLQPGRYPAADFFGPDLTRSGIFWERRTMKGDFTPPSCQVKSGLIIIDAADYVDDRLQRLDLTFEQECHAGNKLRGHLRWVADDPTLPPGPATSVPAGLWKPPVGATPADRNYVYLESSAGDPLANGRTMLYTQSNSALTMVAANHYLRIKIQGNEQWFGYINGMSSLAQLQPGYYPQLLENGFNNPARGYLGWLGFNPVASCDHRSLGWMVVEDVHYEGFSLARIKLRFELACDEGAKPPLRGEIRWSRDDGSRPPLPQAQIPAGLWQPDAARQPAAGSYLYVEGGGVPTDPYRVLTPADARFKVYEADGRMRFLLLDTAGAPLMDGVLRAPVVVDQLGAGYYPALSQYGFNPATGGFSVTGFGRGCAGASWFAIDSVQYSQDVLRSVDLRFEQTCGDASGPLLFRGRLHWTTEDPLVLAGPLDATPAPRSPPPPLVPPLQGTYVQLQSIALDDFIGQGGQYLHTKANAQIQVSALSNDTQAGIRVSIKGAQIWDSVMLVPRNAATPATYSIRQSPARTFYWSGEGRGCNNADGEFTVENLVWSGNDVAQLDMHFIQYCDGGPPLLGTVHWDASDPTAPPGPAAAPPDLWRAPASSLPVSGNYLYLHSPAGDFVGGGGTYLYTPQDASATRLNEFGGQSIQLVVPAALNTWLLRFRPMVPLSRIQPGYYGSLSGEYLLNPAQGGLSISGFSRSCGPMAGWFVIDEVVYQGDALAAIDARFEQRCTDSIGYAVPLRGQIHWSF
jgi:hypothetical protein